MTGIRPSVDADRRVLFFALAANGNKVRMV